MRESHDLVGIVVRDLEYVAGSRGVIDREKQHQTRPFGDRERNVESARRLLVRRDGAVDRIAGTGAKADAPGDHGSPGASLHGHDSALRDVAFRPRIEGRRRDMHNRRYVDRLRLLRRCLNLRRWLLRLRYRLLLL